VAEKYARASGTVGSSICPIALIERTDRGRRGHGDAVKDAEQRMAVPKRYSLFAWSLCW
jgi:hypothetical protein